VQTQAPGLGSDGSGSAHTLFSKSFAKAKTVLAAHDSEAKFDEPKHGPSSAEWKVRCVMARACSICSHPRISEIDAALKGNVAYRRVAKHFEASESSMFRHAKQHLLMRSAGYPVANACRADDAVSAASESDGSAPDRPKESLDLLDSMVRLQNCTLRILESSQAAGRHETALKAIREMRGNADLISKLEEQARTGGGQVFDLRQLSADDIGSLLRASLGELSVSAGRALLLQAPELADLAPASFSSVKKGEILPNPDD
jgi:hypothetical protein